MTNRHWLKREVPAWVKEKLISEEEGKVLLARYRKGKPGPYKEAFFVMALVCLLGGLGFLGAGLWNGLTQDERFLLALVPLLVSLLFVATVVLLDRRIPDDPVAVKGTAMPFGASGVLDEVSDSAGSLERAQRIGKKAQLWGAPHGKGASGAGEDVASPCACLPARVGCCIPQCEHSRCFLDGGGFFQADG